MHILIAFVHLLLTSAKFLPGGIEDPALTGRETDTSYPLQEQVENSPLLAVADTVETTRNTLINISILENDDYDAASPVSIILMSEPSGKVERKDDGTLDYLPPPDFVGSDRFTYRIRQGEETSNTAAVVVIVKTGTAPNFNPDAKDDTATTLRGVAVTIEVLENDSDPDRDEICIAEIAPASHGTVELAPNARAVIYTPDSEFCGIDSFTYSISDGRGGIDFAVVTVEVKGCVQENQDPVVFPDFIDTNEDTPVEIEVLANDTDPDGDTLSVVQVTAPAMGKAEIKPGGVIRYTPDLNCHGSDSFEYIVSDSRDGTDTAAVVVTILPVNDKPVASDDEVFIRGVETVEIHVLENDSDVDGDVLRVSKTEKPKHGRTAIVANERIAYTPEPDFHGVVQFSYTVSDVEGATDKAVVTVHIEYSNALPVARNDTIQTLEDTPVTIDVLCNDEDDESELTLVIINAPLHGTAAIDDRNTGTKADDVVTYTPNRNYNGMDCFTYEIRDSYGEVACADVIISITSVNDPPEPPSISSPGDGVEVAIGGDSNTTPHDPDTPFTVKWEPAVDPEDDSLTYVWQLSSTKEFDPDSVILEVHADASDGLATDMGTVASALTAFGMESLQSRRFFHRVTASDGEHVVSSASSEIVLFRGTITETERAEVIPDKFTLYGCHPNPFNVSCTLRFDVPEDGDVKVEVFDLTGRLVAVIPQMHISAGTGHRFFIDAARWHSGLYVYRLIHTNRHGTSTATGFMTVIK